MEAMATFVLIAVVLCGITAILIAMWLQHSYESTIALLVGEKDQVIADLRPAAEQYDITRRLLNNMYIVHGSVYSSDVRCNDLHCGFCGDGEYDPDLYEDEGFGVYAVNEMRYHVRNLANEGYDVDRAMEARLHYTVEAL